MGTRRFTRSGTDRMLGGVAGGLATFMKVDPLLVRVGFLILGLFNGLGVVIYLLLWVLTPVEGSLAPDTPGQVRENVADMQGTAERFVQQVRDMMRR